MRNRLEVMLGAMLLRAILVCLLALPAPVESPLRRALTALQAIPPDYTNVPAESRPLVVEVKHRLRDVIVEIVSAPDGAPTAPDRLEAAVVARLEAEGVPLERGTADGELGNPWDVTGVEIAYAPGHPDLLVAEATLALTCADDTSLYVFERRDEQWALALCVESNDYEEVSGAACGLEYVVPPRAADGSWYLVTADIACWCTSNWKRVRYKVLAPGMSPDAPVQAFAADETIFLGAGPPPFTLAAAPGGFELRFQGEQSLDMGVLVRELVLRYEVSGDSIRRVAPLATSPEDFVDEWSGLPWGEAKRWVERRARPRARRWHARLRTPAYKVQEILSVEPGAGRPGETEVVLGAREADLVFTVVERDGACFVRSVSARRPGAR
jgi:hypothetical protein